MNESEFAELSAGHALHALSADEESAYQQALAAHPEWAHLVAADAETAAVLADAVPEVAPPPALRDALLAQIAVGPDAAPAPDVAPGPAAPTRSRWTRGLFALAASVVLVLGLGIAAGLIGQSVSTPPAVVALERIESAPDAQVATADIGSSGQAALHWAPSTGQAVLVSDGLPTLASDQAYELWFVRGGEPVSAGVFTAPGGSATALLSGSMQPGDVVAVTIEAAGGSPTGKPTSAPFVAIATA